MVDQFYVGAYDSYHFAPSIIDLTGECLQTISECDCRCQVQTTYHINLELLWTLWVLYTGLCCLNYVAPIISVAFVNRSLTDGASKVSFITFLVISSTLFYQRPISMKTSTEDMNMPIMAMSHCSAAFAPWPKNLGSLMIFTMMVMVSDTLPTWKSRLRVEIQMQIDSNIEWRIVFLKVLIWSPSLWQVGLPVHHR